MEHKFFCTIPKIAAPSTLSSPFSIWASSPSSSSSTIWFSSPFLLLHRPLHHLHSRTLTIIKLLTPSPNRCSPSSFPSSSSSFLLFPATTGGHDGCQGWINHRALLPFLSPSRSSLLIFMLFLHSPSSSFIFSGELDDVRRWGKSKLRPWLVFVCCSSFPCWFLTFPFPFGFSCSASHLNGRFPAHFRRQQVDRCRNLWAEVGWAFLFVLPFFLMISGLFWEGNPKLSWGF